MLNQDYACIFTSMFQSKMRYFRHVRLQRMSILHIKAVYNSHLGITNQYALRSQASTFFYLFFYFTFNQASQLRTNSYFQ